MSALEDIPVENEEVEVDEKTDKRIGKPPSKPFNSETAAAATAERETQRNRRKQGLASRIREMVGDDPGRIANILSDILENTSGKERSTDRIAAARELLDRGWGKAPAYAPIEGGDPLEASDLDRAIRDIADQLIARRAHPRLDAELIRGEIADGIRPNPTNE